MADQYAQINTFKQMYWAMFTQTLFARDTETVWLDLDVFIA